MVVCLVSSPLLSIVPAGLEIIRVLPTTEHCTVEAGIAGAVECPDCGLPSLLGRCANGRPPTWAIIMDAGFGCRARRRRGYVVCGRQSATAKQCATQTVI